MGRNAKNRKSFLLVLLLLIIGISIGYAALTTTLNINGNTSIEKASWDIHFENLVKTEGSVSATTEATIDSTKTIINYAILLMEPGDFYEFTVDIVNAGSIDAMISEVLKEGISADQEKYIEYIATYEDGGELELNDLLKSGSRKNVKVRVKFKEDVNPDDLPTEETVLDLKFSVTYVQADNSANDKGDYICKRATELHTVQCSQTSTSEYCSGAGYRTNGSKGTTTIKYGNETTTEDVLTSGDAFDCDVNGDGTYDSETERFYYVSDLYDTTKKDFDSNYAVLIYYNNTTLGIPDNTAASIIEYHPSTHKNWFGPVSAITYLPTAEQWNNISLSNAYRKLLTQKGTDSTAGGTLPTAFSYETYAARLLTTQEVEFACNTTVVDSGTDGELDTCNYLMENTVYSNSTMGAKGYWLETPNVNSGQRAWLIHGGSRSLSTTSVGTAQSCATRPVIEVLKTNILY